MNVFNTYREMHTADNVTEWARHNPDGLAIVSEVRRMEQEDGR